MNIYFLCLIILIHLQLSSSIKQFSPKKFGTYIYGINTFNQTTINTLVSNITKFNVDLLYISISTVKIKNDVDYKSKLERNIYILLNTLSKTQSKIPVIGFIILQDQSFTYQINHNKSIEQFEILNNFSIPIMNFINQTTIPALIDSEYWCKDKFNLTEDGTDKSTLSNQFFVLLNRIHNEVKPMYTRLKIEVYHSIYTRSFLSAAQTNDEKDVLKSYTYVLANRHYRFIERYLNYYKSNGFKYYIDLENSNNFKSRDEFFDEVRKFASEILKFSEGIVVFSLF